MNVVAKTNEYDIPETMKAWVLGNPHEMKLIEKPVPVPGPAEVLVKVGAIPMLKCCITAIRR